MRAGSERTISEEHLMSSHTRRVSVAALIVTLFGLTVPMAWPYYNRGPAFPSVYGGHFSPGVALPHHPYWGCFGPCSGPLHPHPNHHYWTCFGWCNGPLPPPHHFGGCYSPCPLPYPNPPHYLCYGYCPPPVPPVIYAPTYQPIYNVTYPAGDTTYPALSTTVAKKDKESDQPNYEGKSFYDWMKLLKSSDPKVRASACVAIRNIGPAAKSAIPALIAALKDTDAYVRMEATVALGAIGEAAIPALIDAAKSTSRYQRIGACLALGHMGAKAKEAIASLEPLLKDKNASVRAHAAQAIWRIDPTRAGDIVPVLAEALKDENRAVRMGAAVTLGQIGPAAK